MRTVHLEYNACFACHRVGPSTLKLFMNAGWDANEHMPPHDPGSLKEDPVREVLDVIRKGPEQIEGADWVIPPKGKGVDQVVGDDYPHNAFFNRPGSGSGKFAKNDTSLPEAKGRVKSISGKPQRTILRDALIDLIAYPLSRT